METSPPPTPRKTVQRQYSRQSTTPVRRLAPRASTSRPVSRFATPARSDRLSVVADDDEVASSGMDVDGDDLMDRILKSETVFAKSAEMQVTFYSHLPGEVKQVLRNADFYQDAYTGDIDTFTGFALVASAETCFVWKYTQALTGTPTCYIFSCPQDVSPIHMATPLHALVPYGSSREPGLILATPGGHVRFWDSLGSGLAGGDHFSSLSLELADDERVTTLTRADSQSYIVSTSAGRLFRLTLTSLGGRHHLSPRAFSRPQSSLSLSRLLPTFWSSESSSKSGNINAVALQTSEKTSLGRHVWALIDFRIQRWNMSAEGWEELELDDDVAELIRPALRARFSTASEDDSELDLELLDLKFLSSTELLLLVSYAGQDDSAGMDVSIQPRRIYAIVGLQHSAGSFQVKDVKAVPYQSTSSSGAPTHPRLQLLASGQIVVIQFGDTVTMCARDTDFMDRLELKSASDRTLGVGVMAGDSELLVLTAATLMKTWIDADAVKHFDPETGRANLVRNTMTQAILFGSYAENPLHFSFPPEVDEDALMSGAELLSTQVLQSDPSIIRSSHDLHAQMTTRKERLSFLIKFINDNAVLTKMSQRSRQKLATDAEVLYAAHQLWLRHNEVLATGNPHGVLTDAVQLFMESNNLNSFEDDMRAFFRFHVESLVSLLPAALEIVQKSISNDAQTLLVRLAQANNIVLTILQSAISYRHYNLGVYGITLPMIHPWTSSMRVINIVSELFDTTVKLVELPSADIEPARAKILAKEQLPELASTLFSCYHEQLQWLKSPGASDETGNERAKTDLEDRFKHARPEILETLRRNGFAADAFRLAEDYRDFRSLASLCHKDKVYPPHSNPNAMRIQTYVDKFKEDFTTELFQWYIEHGELRTMFAQNNGPYLDRYFAEHPHPNISWIHDLGNGRYNEASHLLLTDADNANELLSKHLMLSIGKLSHIAQSQEEDPHPINEDILDAFHDGLDFVSVHDNLLDDLKSALASIRVKQSLEMQVDTITKAKASKLGDRRALQNSFKQLTRRMLQGKALSVEDAADVLSLKDNDKSVDDYVTAIHLITRAHTLPEARRNSAVRTIWRRIYIHDDWDRINKTSGATDAEVNHRFFNTALCHVLQNVNRKVYLRPAEVKETPTLEEIASRWPGIPQDEVEALYRDYRWESNRLVGLGVNDEVFMKALELAHTS
ncbi:Non-repetitive/WGA-negative nucleoporin C-terminal-domain-containing protein [Cristinia sonorae]|uniref:Non-repetitive/WGA-negative nucleoporin C-terminal-domain-containing protein n=1 Tax=Cristinia sonorae TaxID=1940300 RepID=A0A8K0UYT8_9AGAR|nr:Non-repetitive/WGA-negative nucleoporin C-terminal-domain-containing protein [Cristinia sonorae]